MDYSSLRQLYLVLEDRSRVDERVELAVLTAWVDAGGQGPEEGTVVLPATELLAQPPWVDAAHDGLEAQLDELPRKLSSISSPEGKETPHPNLPESLLSVLANVLQEEIAEGNLLDALAPVLHQRVPHLRLVNLVRRVAWYPDLLQWKAQGRGLLVQETASDAVHAYPVEFDGHCCEQGLDLVSTCRSQLPQGEGAVFTAAP